MPKKSHASIDPAVRAARNLPEDLIRLCVGIEDAQDLIDDLEAALLEAGAVRVVEDEDGSHRIVRVRSLNEVEDGEGRGGREASGGEVDAVEVSERLRGLGLESTLTPPGHLVTSAPGKVILFGEHAVVHGVVSFVPFRACTGSVHAA